MCTFTVQINTHRLTALSHWGVYIRGVLLVAARLWAPSRSLILKLICPTLIVLAALTVYPCYIIWYCLSLSCSLLHPPAYTNTTPPQTQNASSEIKKKTADGKLGWSMKSVGWKSQWDCFFLSQRKLSPKSLSLSMQNRQWASSRFSSPPSSSLFLTVQ